MDRAASIPFMSKVLKFAVVSAVLLAGSGVFYHYTIFLPGLERKKQADVEREKQDATQRETAREERRKQAYATCLSTARDTYEANWAAACKSVAQSRDDGLRSCLRDRVVEAAMCRQMWGQSDPSPDCTLPGERGKSVNDTFTQAKEQCLAEAKLGLN